MFAAVIDGKEGGVFVSNDIQRGNASEWTRLPAPPRTAGHPWTID
eukprot:COSAG04_NODE_8586_length_954_cov_0.782456_2_plen_44_part_01